MKKEHAICYYQTLKDVPKQNQEKEEALQEYCRANSYHYHDTSRDLNEHGKRDMDYMMECIKEKTFTVMVVYSLYDMAMDNTELLRYLKQIHDSGVHFVAIKENINTRYFESRELLRLANILLKFSQWRWSEKSKQQIALAIKTAREEGRELGKRGKDKKKRKNPHKQEEYISPFGRRAG